MLKEKSLRTRRLFRNNGRSLVIAMDHARVFDTCLLYTSPSPRDRQKSRMPSSA